MIVHRTEHPQWLSNAYLLTDERSGDGVLVDGHGEGQPLIDRAEREGIEVRKIVLTHHHMDHVDIAQYRARYDVPVVAHPRAAAQLGGVVDETVEDAGLVEAGGLRLRAILTEGHAAGHLALLAEEGGDCLTADVLFAGTVGGTRAPGATGYADLRASVMERLLTLPPETRLHPGHREPTTVAAEWEGNPFVRVWRGLEPEGAEPCTVQAQPATLVLWAPDYDGTNKAWVRFPDGQDAIVGGSQVRR